MEAIAIGKSIPRKESADKVTGAVKYHNDQNMPGILHAKMLTSSYAHAKIQKLDISEAMESSGVRAVITGNQYSLLCGPILEDRPPLARDKVRYFGEPIAVVVADSEQEAKLAVQKLKIEYQQLPVVNSKLP